MTRIYFKIKKQSISPNFYIVWLDNQDNNTIINLRKPVCNDYAKVVLEEIKLQDMINVLRICDIVDYATDLKSVAYYIDFDSDADAINFKLEHYIIL